MSASVTSAAKEEKEPTFTNAAFCMNVGFSVYSLTIAVLQLFEAGAYVKAVGGMSEAPRPIATRKQNISAIEAMLEADAEISYMSEFGRSLRDFADEIGGDVRRVFINR